MILGRKPRSFALPSVHLNPSFEASNSTIHFFFFRLVTICRDPCDLGGLTFTGIVLQGPKFKTRIVLESEGQASHYDTW